MAGGIGSRFWPLSREEKPKQFVDALGIGKTFIQLTYERFARFIPNENFLVMTGLSYKDLVLEQLPMLKPEQVLTEPCRRNTAPCIAYAMFKLLSRDPEAVAVVTPSDQYIGHEASFQQVMQESLDFVSSNPVLMTVGIAPTYPATGYGYIQCDRERSERFTPVLNFKEKPDLPTAVRYLAEPVGIAGLVKQSLSQCGLTTGTVACQRNIPYFTCQILFHGVIAPFHFLLKEPACSPSGTVSAWYSSN